MSCDNLEPIKGRKPDGVHSYRFKECSESLDKSFKYYFYKSISEDL